MTIEGAVEKVKLKIDEVGKPMTLAEYVEFLDALAEEVATYRDAARDDLNRASTQS